MNSRNQVLREQKILIRVFNGGKNRPVRMLNVGASVKTGRVVYATVPPRENLPYEGRFIPNPFDTNPLNPKPQWLVVQIDDGEGNMIEVGGLPELWQHTPDGLVHIEFKDA